MRLIDADALKTELMLAAERLVVSYEAHGEGYVAHSEDIITCNKMNELLRNFPTADAVPVVRCKDCTFWRDFKMLCPKVGICHLYRNFRDDYDYCSFGARKDDAEQEGE